MAHLPKGLQRLGPGLLCAAAGAAAAYQLGLQGGSLKAECEVPPPVPRPPPAPATAVTVMAMRRWLEQQGADIGALDFKTSPTVRSGGAPGPFATTSQCGPLQSCGGLPSLQLAHWDSLSGEREWC